jgi:hypothetical protein
MGFDKEENENIFSYLEIRKDKKEEINIQELFLSQQ